MKYDTVVGLEVHVQLNTLSKAFCGDAIRFGDAPNTHTSPISLAHPGTLPVANRSHIKKAVQLGLALDCQINDYCYFDRKHYFYPDLPKGYQITQDGQPICIGGHLQIPVQNGMKKIRIHHIHMEEDAGKTVHDQHDIYSLVDLNRAGTPLLELVTEPDLSSGEEVYVFIAELQKILRFLQVSDADMEKGSLRCDCNVSIKPAGNIQLGERCEIKNLNSKKFAKEAVEYEVRRQTEMVQNEIDFTKQTLHYDPSLKKTMIMREKEGAQDYRYFVDPDLSPIQLTQSYIQALSASLPELPSVLKDRLISDGFSPDYADQLTQSPSIFQEFKKLSDEVGDPFAVANFLINHLLPKIGSSIESWLNERNKKKVIEFLKFLKSGTVSASMAYQKLWPRWLEEQKETIHNLADQLGILIKQDQDFLDRLIEETMNANTTQVNQYRNGKKSLIGFFIGEVMKKSKGSANPKILRQKLIESLKA